jgi:hypothetical protein
VVTDDTTDRRILSEIDDARVRLLEEVRAEVASRGHAGTARLGRAAEEALSRHVTRLLDTLIEAASQAAHGARDDVETWIRRRFHESLGLAACNLRDTLADSSARHAVAQALQRQMFMAENALQKALAASRLATKRETWHSEQVPGADAESYVRTDTR